MRLAGMGVPLAVRIGANIGPRSPSGCREWLGARSSGYATIKDGGQVLKVTRVLLGLRPGDRRVAMHVCDNPPCVERSHLRIGTYLDNARDMLNKGRGRSALGERASCVHGHAFTAENVMRRPGHGRLCRECLRIRREKYRSPYKDKLDCDGRPTGGHS